MFSSRVEDEMESMKEKTVRFLSDEKTLPVKSNRLFGRRGATHPPRIDGGLAGGSKFFPEEHEAWQKWILDPASDLVVKWNRVFLGACLVALFVDPLFFYLPIVDNASSGSPCIKLGHVLSVVLTVVRTLADIFYFLQIVVKFHTAYDVPSTRVFGRGEFVRDHGKIARRYLQRAFLVDFFAALPLPQIVIWIILPAVKRTSNADHNNNTIALIVLLQYFLRLYLMSRLISKIIDATGVVTSTAWGGAAYNLCFYMLASHVIGALWYLLSIDRQSKCWESTCADSNYCYKRYFDCEHLDDPDRIKWAMNTTIFGSCNATDTSIPFKYGIFASALTKDVVSAKFQRKYFFCLWWGLQQLSSYGQNLTTSTFIGETSFAIVLAIAGLVLFAHLIGNMQTYLQSMTVRLEEWRLKRRDTEEWMSHRQLPHDLRKRVRKYVQYKWFATKGVDEDAILQGLPPDLRRDIQRHLCLDLVRRVPFFSQMDEPLLDAICERLVSCLSTEGSYIVREGDLVTEMIFVIRGKLESSTTNGGRTGFFNSTILSPGDFCGEELLTWALQPKGTASLPSSTQTVKALIEVEAFALRAEDLKFVSNQFRKLHSKKFQYTFRIYSHQWRTWAACFIQAAWHRFQRRKIAKDLSTQVSFASRYEEHDEDEPNREESYSSDNPTTEQNLVAKALASKLSASTKRGSKKMERPQKPEEPNFLIDPF